MIYDLIIIGAGPAGLTAALYASRYRIKTLVIGRPFESRLTEGYLIENYPGFPSISGLQLIEKFVKQVKSYNTEILEENVVEINKENITFKVQTEQKKIFQAKSLIIASGTEKRRLSIAGEKEFLGKGVSYCATCDAPLFKEKIVAVIGGSNSALMAAELLSKYAQKVYLIYRQKSFRAEPIWQERIKREKKIIPLFETNPVKIEGKKFLEKIILDKEYQGQKELKVDGLIIEIGSEPVSKLVKNLGVELDEQGLIKINTDGSTNIEGVFAAGDITTGSNKFRQIVTACAEGAIAALGVYNYLRKI
ncbi:MAG: FAD-dependent oxidoreductase [Patescibacteria group bacterium]|nr:FAD-dependent oxidoreductase [Patescibacteria group bacterium]